MQIAIKTCYITFRIYKTFVSLDIVMIMLYHVSLFCFGYHETQSSTFNYSDEFSLHQWYLRRFSLDY